MRLVCATQNAAKNERELQAQSIREDFISTAVFTATTTGTERPVSINTCSVEGNSAGIPVSNVSSGIFVIKVK